MPWYGSGSYGVLPPGGETITISMTDEPYMLAYEAVEDDQGRRQVIRRVDVDETFILSLYDKTAGHLERQWEWGYGHTAISDENARGGRRIAEHDERGTVPLGDPTHLIKLELPLATENPRSTWSWRD